MSDELLLEVADRVFADTCSPEIVRRAEVDGWAAEAWDAIANVGLPWVSVDEASGGSGGSVADAAAVLTVAGRHAAPLPIAENGLLGGWLLSAAGLPVGQAPVTVVPSGSGDVRLRNGRLSGTAHGIPWARSVSKIVALVDDHVTVVDTSQLSIVHGTNLAGEPRDSVVFEETPVEAVRAPAGMTTETLMMRGALSRAALMSGALMAMADRTVAYTAQRQQFGRAVGSFQSVQEHVVRCAEEAALVDLAVQIAVNALERGGGQFEVAAAKAVANDAARIATRAAHQAHGAMGMTREYPLHLLSRRLWSWRAEYGDAIWRDRIGLATARQDPDRLYFLIADGSASGISV
jgi:acyl-CoA dehydrogenase